MTEEKGTRTLEEKISERAVGRWRLESSLLRLAKDMRDGDEDYLAARSIILDLHLVLDSYISFILALKLGKNLRSEQIKKIAYCFLKLKFYEKSEILEELRFLNPREIETVKQINSLRNDLVHIERKGKYKYFGQGISSANIIIKIQGDVKTIIDKIKAEFKK